MDPGQDDSAAIDRAIAGDMKALTKILEAHAPRVLAYVQRHFPSELRGITEPTDVVQDTCFEACRLIGGFVPKGDDCFYRWLVTVARHRMVDMVRTHRARTKLGRIWTDMAANPIISILEDLAIYRRTPSRSAASHEFMRALEQALGRLPPEQAQAVTLRHVQGLSVPDTAAEMGRTEDAVYYITSRALQALRIDLKSLSPNP